MSKYHRVVGIDLGTTYSVVATFNHDRKDILVIPNAKMNNERTTPSVVYVSAQGDVEVGKGAKKKLETDPKGVIYEVKRIMGEKNADGTKRMAVARGREIDPEAVSAHILRVLKLSAEKAIGEPVYDAIITVPAYFLEPQKNATKEAARMAGLNVRKLINEPTAAALAYAADSEEVQNFLVYDFGGGTFDVSVVRMDEATHGDVVGTGGDSHLGGGDIDESIVKWALGKMQAEHGKDFSGDVKLRGRLRTAAEDVKIRLCALADGGSVDFELAYPTPGVDAISYPLTTVEFERQIQPYLARTLAQVDRALESSKTKGVTIDDIGSIILVGGSSKIPAVSRVLKERYGKPIRSNLNPDEIVAMGAAIDAAGLPPSLGVELADDAEIRIDKTAVPKERLESTEFRDVVSHTLGIGLKDNVYDPLIPKDQFIPHKVVRGGYTTAEDNQTSIYVPIFQGDNPKADKNHRIGKVVIHGLSAEPQGHHKFEITFALDESGLFDGQVRNVTTNAIPVKAELDRGHGQITEKKRMEIGALVAQGKIAMQPADPIDQLVLRATEAMAALTPAKQREVTDLLVKLSQARATQDEQAKAGAITALTLFLGQSQN